MKDLLIKCGTAILICFLAAAFGSYFTDTGSWYESLNKPSFNPPSWIFAPVWITLYIFMGIAAGLVWHQGLQAPGVKTALIFFITQLLLNALWSFSFFGLQSPVAGLINILLLVFVLAITLLIFLKIQRLAGILLSPYLAWVLFAAFLNWQIVGMN